MLGLPDTPVVEERMKYISKPVEVEAVQFTGGNYRDLVKVCQRVKAAPATGLP